MTARRRIASRTLSRRRTRTTFWLITSPATGMRSLTTRISCPTLMRVSSASLKRPLMPLFREMGETVHAVKLVPQDKVQNCTMEQIVAVAAGEMIQLLSRGRISERIIEQTVEVPIPQIRVHSVEAMKVILRERLAIAHREAECGRSHSSR